ncbi:MAG: hypothetical protein ABSG84_17810 [Acidobacteriaceae bacterium]|jgi:hypothetical protein
MDSPGLPYLIQDEQGLNRRTLDKLEALQNLMELIRQDSLHPSRIRAYVHQADKLLRTMQIDLWQSGP